jgi:hypothetical protein
VEVEVEHREAQNHPRALQQLAAVAAAAHARI